MCIRDRDGVIFLKNGGQKGRQTTLLTAGYYRINPVLFKVIPNVPITTIGSDKFGIVTVMDGAPMVQGEMAAPIVSGHDNFQNPDAFVHSGGCRGLQEQIMLAGTYN